MIDEYFTVDFYIPSEKLVIEINGVRAFYPYTRKETQYHLLKNKLLRGSNKKGVLKHNSYHVFNLNTHVLEGLTLE